MVLYQSCGPQAVTVKWSRALDSDFDLDADERKGKTRVYVRLCASYAVVIIIIMTIIITHNNGSRVEFGTETRSKSREKKRKERRDNRRDENEQMNQRTCGGKLPMHVCTRCHKRMGSLQL